MGNLGHCSPPLQVNGTAAGIGETVWYTKQAGRQQWCLPTWCTMLLYLPARLHPTALQFWDCGFNFHQPAKTSIRNPGWSRPNSHPSHTVKMMPTQSS